jgi:hypothetical protein
MDTNRVAIQSFAHTFFLHLTSKKQSKSILELCEYCCHTALLFGFFIFPAFQLTVTSHPPHKDEGDAKGPFPPAARRCQRPRIHGLRGAADSCPLRHRSFRPHGHPSPLLWQVRRQVTETARYNIFNLPMCACVSQELDAEFFAVRFFFFCTFYCVESFHTLVRHRGHFCMGFSQKLSACCLP